LVETRERVSVAAKAGVFWGCYIPALQPFAEAAFRLILDDLGLSLSDVRGIACCPSPFMFKILDYEYWLETARANLDAIASDFRAIVTLCNGCWDSLLHARDLVENPPEVLHIAEFLIGLRNALLKRIQTPLQNLRVAVHVGCKPRSKPSLVDAIHELTALTGARIVNWRTAKICCGYPLFLAKPDEALETRVRVKVEDVQQVGADAIVVVCPACFMLLERGQLVLRRKGLRQTTPVLHLVELLALALGHKGQEIGLDAHAIKPKALLESIG